MTELTSHKTAIDWALSTILWSRHCGLASPNTYPTSLHASRSMICRFVTTIRLLPPVSVTDIVRFRRCRVPIDYFVQLDPWRPTKHARHHYPPVRCLWCCVKGWEYTFYANLMLFRTNLSWAFTCRACIFSWNHTNFVYLFCNSKA